MRKRLGIAVAVGVMAAPLVPATAATAATPTEGQTFSAEKNRAISSIVASGRNGAGTFGMNVGVWVKGRGKFVRADGVSDLDTQDPLQLDDHMRIASNTKTFVATAVLQLVDQGEIELADTLESYVPGIDNGSVITIEQMLNMTSGIFSYTNDDQFLADYIANPEMAFDLDAVLDIIDANDPVFPPGTQAQYSDSNYYLLGHIIELVTGQPLNTVIQTSILDPLGMTETLYPTTSAMPEPFSKGYYPLSDAEPRDVTLSNPAVAGGAGAMVSTVGDMKIWAKALATGTLLTPETQALRLETNVLATNQYVTAKYGLGILNINGFLGHDGTILGYGSASLYLRGKKATIIVFGNTNTLFATPTLGTALAIAAYLFPKRFPNGIS